MLLPSPVSKSTQVVLSQARTWIRNLAQNVKSVPRALAIVPRSMQGRTANPFGFQHASERDVGMD